MSDNIQTQLRRLCDDSQQLGIDLTTLTTLKNHSRLTRFGTTTRILGALAIVAILVAVPRYCMSYKDCHLNVPVQMEGAFRAVQDCAFCENVVQVDRVQDIRPDAFERDYAYNGRPVVVTDATHNWTAMEV